MIVEPKTYTGYDEEGNAVCTVSAQDANNDINPIDVQAAINSCNETVESEINNIKTALSKVEPEANDALVVQGTQMGPVIEGFCSSLDTIPSSLSENLDGLYTDAVSVHNELQLGYNTAAESEAWNGSGVVRVSS